MNKSKKINSQKGSETPAVIVGVLTFAVVASVIALIAVNYISSTSEHVVDWIISGPFTIDKQTYRMGEPVFLIASGIGPKDNSVDNLIDLSNSRR